MHRTSTYFFPAEFIHVMENIRNFSAAAVAAATASVVSLYFSINSLSINSIQKFIYKQ